MLICADDPESAFKHLSEIPEDIIKISPDDPVGGSAAAACLKTDRVFKTVVQRPPNRLPVSKPDGRMGVYICRCGDDMGGIIRTRKLQESIQKHEEVAHSGILAYACSMEAATKIKQDIAAHELNRVVLAACSCCSSDQVCFSCTFQRVRCKENLGLYQPLPGFSGNAEQDPAMHTIFEFVNIREQCAWVHSNNPAAATGKALVLIEGAISRIKGAAVEYWEPLYRDRAVMILGRGRASQHCLEALKHSGVKAVHLQEPSSPIDYTNGYYTTHRNGQLLKALSIIVAPKDVSETDQIVHRLNTNESGPGISYRPGQIETTRPGVFFCDPDLERDLAGRAVAARCRAWMGRIQGCPPRTSGIVNPDRCRMCYTCMGICETGAPQAVGRDSDRHVWIDPAICTGCGACAASCPSNAIRAGDATDGQMEGMIADMLSLERAGCGA
jgi:heterodisulfide reductase subunit A-like polyferredoxin